ncbi:MAG: BMP family ABC transporter substrate-binding protein [Christensenellales bacterium]|jgi:basic membrane protein A
MKKILALALAALMVCAIFAGCAKTQDTGDTGAEAPVSDAAESVKVGFIYVGPVGDGGFTAAHDAARLAMQENMKDYNVETFMVENVPESSDCATAIESLIKQQGCTIIFATSFGHQPYVVEMAEKYPDVTFFHCSGYETRDNLSQYFGRMYQPRYLSGIAAGAATQTDKIGYVAAMGIPEVIRGINAFTLGVRSVNPDAEVQVVWTNTWYDPTLERSAAQSLLDAGCDVIAQHQDTFEPVAAAEEANAYSVGYHTSMLGSAPNGYLTAPIWNLANYYTESVKSVIDGTYVSSTYWGGLETGTVLLDVFGPSVSEETKALIAEKQQAIIDGTWDVFYGEIKDQAGEVRVAEGESLTDEEIWGIDWFVEGVVGSVN